MKRSMMPVLSVFFGLVVACGAADEEASPAGEQDVTKAAPKLKTCQTLAKQVDSCLDELGSIGGSLDDCIDTKNKKATACCGAFGSQFNYCKPSKPSTVAPQTLQSCQTLAKQVDSCLDELGSIGGSLDDCIDTKTPKATACCRAFGKQFNYCR